MNMATGQLRRSGARGMRALRRLGVGLGTVALTSCSRARQPEITLQVGPDQILHFSPVSAYAQYFELPGQGDLLRIVLASYAVPCKTYLPPSKGEVYVAVTLHVDDGQPISGTEFGWDGTVPSFAPLHPVVAGSAEPTTGASNWALPYVRLANEGRPLPPGGKVKISAFAREAFGIVEGDFQFSDAGDGEAATAALLGAFRVQLCHVELDPNRAASLSNEREEHR